MMALEREADQIICQNIALNVKYFPEGSPYIWTCLWLTYLWYGQMATIHLCFK